MKRTNILHLLLSLNIGGAERVAVSVVKGSASDCFEHEVCCLDEIGVFGQDLERHGFRTTLLRRKQDGVDWFLIPRLAAFLRRHRIDIIHAHGETPWFYAALACLLTLGKAKCLTTIHGYGGGDRAGLKNYRLWRILTALSHKVVLVADNLRRELLQQKFPDGKLQTILNGIDLHRVYASPVEERSTWGIDESEIVIGIVARLSVVKNHQLLIQAFTRLKGAGTKARLVIVGDGPERAPLEEMVALNGLTDNVVFCGAQTASLGFYRMFDVFVLPSLSEGISMTLLEALANKVPVIASRVGGNPEIIVHGKTGLLFESGDCTALTQNLFDLIHDSSKRSCLAQAGYRDIQTKFSYDHMIEKYDQLYSGIGHQGVTG